MESLLFVYGTLRPRHANRWSGFLAARSRPIGEGVVEGELLLLGGYPGLVAGKGPVHGDLRELTGDAEETLAALDAYEGPMFRRTPMIVTLADGGRREAITYRYTGPADGYPVIGGGEFLPPEGER